MTVVVIVRSNRHEKKNGDLLLTCFCSQERTGNTKHTKHGTGNIKDGLVLLKDVVFVLLFCSLQRKGNVQREQPCAFIQKSSSAQYLYPILTPDTAAGKSGLRQRAQKVRLMKAKRTCGKEENT